MLNEEVTPTDPILLPSPSHSNKTTSWVDPRSKNTRVHDIMKCKIGGTLLCCLLRDVSFFLPFVNSFSSFFLFQNSPTVGMRKLTRKLESIILSKPSCLCPCKHGGDSFSWVLKQYSHNTQSTYLDPPWDPRIRFQVRQLQTFLADQIEIYKVDHFLLLFVLFSLVTPLQQTGQGRGNGNCGRAH